MLLITHTEAQTKIAGNLREIRLEKGLTQSGLSARAGVSLSTLRKFENTGAISFESFIKLSLALGVIEKVLSATNPTEMTFKSIDDVVKGKKTRKPQRGWRE